MEQLNPDLNSIRELNIKYSEQSISKSYLGLQNSLRIDRFLKYKRPIDKTSGVPIYAGAFHFALNVQILSDGSEDFIPFVFLLNGDDGKYDIAKKWVRESIEKKTVKYNYTEFFRDVRELLIRENVLGEEDFSEFCFSVRFSQQESRYLLYDFKLNESSKIKTSGTLIPESISDEINELIKQKDGTDFIQLLSTLYCNSENGIGAKELHFSVYGLDGDFQTEEKLTHFFMAAEDKGEITDFFFNYVRKVRDLASYIRTRFTYDLIKKNQWEAIKSAISAIMSRNMSHNLGSHYLYYTKAHLEKIATDFLGFGDQLGQYAPDVRGAAKVLGYVQGRMDYLATVISNDKYPYGAVNFKSHIFDELTIDDFSARHFDTEKKRNLRTTNYLLTNLVLSENFTRPNVRDGEFPLGKYLLLLRAKLMMQPGIYSEFTGFVDNMEEENDVKKQLAQLHIALPGGTMSCHAFFNVIENFIRNSAKYLQADFKSIEEGLPYLNCTIAIRPNKDNKDFYDFIIYDNKENANKPVDPATHMTLFESIVGNVDARTINESEIVKKEELGILGRLRITDENGHIEKEAKGIKEMLFSSVWMNAYHFGDNTYADIIAHINDFFDPEKDKVTYKMYKEKLEYIESYAFKFVQVIDNGERLRVFTREQMQANQEKDVTASLGLLITLPEFKQEGYFVPNEDDKLTKQNLLTLFADIVNVPKKYAYQNEKIDFSGCFTRPFYDETKDASVDKFRTILRRRFKNFDKYAIQLGDDSSESLLGPQGTERSYIIRFKRHMNKDKASLFEKNRDYAYADSVSGGNFTITLQQLLEEGWKGGSFNEETQFFALKVIESALTRITIIDERLFNSGAKGNEDELSLKNIRVLNYNTFEDKMSDVIVSCNKYISQGIRGEKGDLELIEFIKQRATEAITEAFISVKRCPQDKLSVDEQLYLKNKKEYVCDSILDALSNAINEATDLIERYKAESDINTKMSYKKAIRNYVDTLRNRIKNASALVELVEPYVDDIKDLIVSAVNEFANGNLSCILQGNNFRNGKENTLFLSIHLGLIEKMLKNSEWLNCEITNRLASKNASARKSQKATDRLSKERVEEFMSILKEKFISTDNEGNNELFIAIHSGRGNFSKELEGPLKTYPFITLSAIENAFNNSKYLLSQVFYNTVYIGKGIANEQ